MIRAVEYKCALQAFKIGFIGVPLNIPFFLEICVVSLS